MFLDLDPRTFLLSPRPCRTFPPSPICRTPLIPIPYHPSPSSRSLAPGVCLLLQFFPDYMNTIDKTTQWERPTQRAHSTGGPRGGRPQSIDAPMARRGSNASSFQSHHSAASSGDPSHHRAAAAPIASVVAAAPPESRAPPAPALGSAPAAPSYNTAVFLSNSSAASGLPPNWHKRTTDEGKTCE